MTRLNHGKDLVEYWLSWIGMPKGCVIIQEEEDCVPDFGNFGYWDMKKFAGCIRIEAEWVLPEDLPQRFHQYTPTEEGDEVLFGYPMKSIVIVSEW
jgi:hypothetical protein